MKTLVAIGVFLVLGAGIGWIVQHDSGYVLLSYDVYSIEMSLALLAAIIVASFALLYFGLRLLSRAVQLPSDVRNWNRRRGNRQAQRALTRGLMELSEGKLVAAEKHLTRHARHSETPLLNYLVAARSAHLQGKQEQRDDYLRLAHDNVPEAQLAIGISQAEMQLADQQHEAALATLENLRRVTPKHPQVLRLLMRLYDSLGDWDKLKDLLPSLKRQKVAPADELHRLEVRLHRALLERGFVSVEKTRLADAWRDVPRALKHEPLLIGDYTGYLLERGRDDEAELLIRDALKRHWDPALVELYGSLDTDRPARQLQLMEDFLKRHPDDPTLLLCLGRICLRNKLWGKARGYLEACIGAGGPPQAYRELGHLLEQLGEEQSALDVYRNGLIGQGGPEPIPLPASIGPTQKKVAAGEDEEINAPPQNAPGA